MIKVDITYPQLSFLNQFYTELLNRHRFPVKAARELVRQSKIVKTAFEELQLAWKNNMQGLIDPDGNPILDETFSDEAGNQVGRTSESVYEQINFRKKEFDETKFSFELPQIDVAWMDGSNVVIVPALLEELPWLFEEEVNE